MEIQFNNPYYSNITKCNYLQRYIIIHSIIYYILDTNVVSDKQYDRVCKQLLNLSKVTENYDKTEYYSVFKDFTGVTGFDLYYKLNKQQQEYLLNIAKYIVKQYNKGK